MFVCWIFAIEYSVDACYLCPTIFICGWISVALVSIFSVVSASSSVTITVVVVAIGIVGVVDLGFECVDCLK